jgi:putative DNA primase/helicase
MSVAEFVTAAIGGTWHGHYGTARCVAHDDRHPSLLLRDGDKPGVILVHCYAGCERSAILDVLRRRGLLGGSSPATLQPAPPAAKRDDGRERRIAAARKIWDNARTIDGTTAAAYLAGRGLGPPFPRVLRFHRALMHKPSGQRLPALVALVAAPDGSFSGVHRTFLANDAPARKAEVDAPKMMLGVTSRGAVRLAVASDELAVGEGLETCLSYLQAERIPTWAALSTAGMRSIELPPRPIASTVEIIVDADAAGEAAAQDLAARLATEGRAVRLVRPLVGGDMNDALRDLRDDDDALRDLRDDDDALRDLRDDD